VSSRPQRWKNSCPRVTGRGDVRVGRRTTDTASFRQCFCLDRPAHLRVNQWTVRPARDSRSASRTWEPGGISIPGSRANLIADQFSLHLQPRVLKTAIGPFSITDGTIISVADNYWAIAYWAHFTEFSHPPDEGAGGRHQGRHGRRSTPGVVEIRLLGTDPQRLLLRAMPADRTGFIRRVCVAEVR
jgi:hypothetical protein